MGRLGPYRCFTREREAKTVKSHLSTKPLEDEFDVFYDVPMNMSEMMMKPSNKHRSRFLKGNRFERIQHENSPPPTKYYPQNFVMKAAVARGSLPMTEKPLFYYPSTTVPVKEMLFNKETFLKPPPGRYDPHDVTCKCYLAQTDICPGNVAGDGHKHVFESNIFRLVRPVPIDKSRVSRREIAEELFPKREREPREPFSFRMQRSMSLDDVSQPREIRYNTMVKKRNLFSVKTGRPVAFLSAAPRFRSSSDAALKLEKENKKLMLTLTDEAAEQPQRKPITKKRLAELATPKYPREKIVTHRIKVFEPLPSVTKVVKKLSIVESTGAMSDIELDDEVVGNASVVYVAPNP